MIPSSYIPKANLAAEKIESAMLAFNLLVVFSALWLALTITAWFVEYAIWRINLVTWLVERWYLHLGILLFLIVGQRISSRKRGRAWVELVSLARSNADLLEGLSDSEFVTGGIRFSDVTIGPVTVSVDESGLALWKSGVLAARYPWAQFTTISVQTNKKGGIFARLVFVWRTPNQPPVLVVPWRSEMTRKLPATMR